MDDDARFDIGEELDELRCHTTEWLRRELRRLVRCRRGIEAQELAVTKVLDERATRESGAEDALVAEHESARTARARVEMARRLEAQPEIAAAVHAGELSTEQLKPLLELATPETDAEWAQRAPHVAPVDLERMARQQRVVTAEEAEARRQAREFRTWWRKDSGMLSVRGELPDVDGALVESVFNRMCDRMRPAKGHAWTPRNHRMADALVDLCRNYADVDPTGRSRPHVIIQKPASGPAEVNGIPIADATLDALHADARVEHHTVDDSGRLITSSNLDQIKVPADIERFVRSRDRHCRVPGCENAWRLQLHHMKPRCAGGNHDPKKLCLVCPQHHPMLEPHGPYQLVGDPDQVDGLRLVRVTDLARDGPAG
jgi:hypothetical protein